MLLQILCPRRAYQHVFENILDILTAFLTNSQTENEEYNEMQGSVSFHKHLWMQLTCLFNMVTDSKNGSWNG